MPRVLVAIDALARADDAFLETLAMETGRPVAEWRRDLIAPALARALLAVDSAAEADAWMSRLQPAGLTCIALGAEFAADALANCFLATAVERRGAELVFSATDAPELVIRSDDIDMFGAGANDGDSFVALGLTREPGAVLMLGSQTSCGDVAGEFALLPAALAVFAPRARIERGLETATDVEALLAVINGRRPSDLFAVSAVIRRRFTAARRAEKQRTRDLPVPAVVTAVAAPPTDARRASPRAPWGWLSGGAALLAALIVLGALWPEAPPDRANHVLTLGSPWQSPWGVTFTLHHGVDPSLGVVSRALVVLDARRGETLLSHRIARGPPTEWRAHGLVVRAVPQPGATVIDRITLELAPDTGPGPPTSTAAPVARTAVAVEASGSDAQARGAERLRQRTSGANVAGATTTAEPRAAEVSRPSAPIALERERAAASKRKKPKKGKKVAR